MASPASLQFDPCAKQVHSETVSMNSKGWYTSSSMDAQRLGDRGSSVKVKQSMLVEDNVNMLGAKSTSIDR